MVGKREVLGLPAEACPLTFRTARSADGIDPRSLLSIDLSVGTGCDQ